MGSSRRCNVLQLALVSILLSVVGMTDTARSDIIYNHEGKYSRDDDVLAIFTGRQRYWNDGSRITVFIKPISSIEHKVFVSEWLGISPTRYREIIAVEQTLAGAPVVKEVTTDVEMLAAITLTPNSIGYLDDRLLIRKDSKVKILSH